MKNISTLLMSILAAFVVSYGVVSFQKTDTVPVKTETAFDRVTKSKTLRCGYIVIPPELIKDPNTGKLSGLAYDLTEDMAGMLGLKVDWVEEAPFSAMAEGLDTGRYDAVCFTLYRLAFTAMGRSYTSVPVFYSGTGIYVRADDTRFDADVQAINDPGVTISTIDGEMSSYLAPELFPRAKTLSMPQGTDFSLMMLNVADGKADVAFVGSVVAQGFLKANPGKVKDIAKAKPLRVFSHGFSFGRNEYALGKLFDTALTEMHEQGKIDALIDKYEEIPGSYYRVTTPYRIGGEAN